MSNQRSADNRSADNTAASITSNELQPSAGRDSGIEVKPAIAPLADCLHAYETLKPEVDAFPKERAAVINADVGIMTQNALWAARQLEKHKDQIAREASTYDLRRIDKLRILALALNYLHARHRFLKDGNKTEEAAQLIQQRDELRKGIDFLVSRRFVSPQSLSNAGLTTGHHATAYDIIAFVDILMSVSDRVSAPPYWSRTELEEIRRKADAFFDLLGDKEFGPGAHAEIKLARRKVFAMLNELWNDLYFTLQYVRRAEGDVGTIMPALYPSRTSRKGAGSTTGQSPAGASSNTQSGNNTGSGTVNDTVDDTVDDSVDDEDDDDDEAIGTLDIAAINAAATRMPSGTSGEEVPPGFPGSRPLRPLESK